MVAGEQLMMLSDTESLTYVGMFTVSGNVINGTVASINAGEGDDTITVSNADTVTNVITGGAGTDELTLTD